MEWSSKNVRCATRPSAYSARTGLFTNSATFYNLGPQSGIHIVGISDSGKIHNLLVPIAQEKEHFAVRPSYLQINDIAVTQT